MPELLKPLASAFIATALLGGGMAAPALAGDKYDDNHRKSWEKKDKDDCDDWDYYYKWKHGDKVKVWYCDDDDDDKKHHHKKHYKKHNHRHHNHNHHNHKKDRYDHGHSKHKVDYKHDKHHH